MQCKQEQNPKQVFCFFWCLDDGGKKVEGKYVVNIPSASFVTVEEVSFMSSLLVIPRLHPICC